METQRETLFWPMNHTFDEDPESTKLVEVLDRMRVPYAGSSPEGFALGSKLDFKQALQKVGLGAPEYRVVTGDDGEFEGVDYPIFVKTEFSCDSEGVRLAHTEAEARREATALGHRFGQRVFLERPAGSVEWTIGCIIVDKECLSASLGLQPRYSDFIDVATKANNELLDITRPDPSVAETLHAYVTKLVTRLSLQGYFRLDVLTSPNGTIQAIDMNLLPFLNASRAARSYLPMAFMLDRDCSYEDVIGAIIASAVRPGATIEPGSALETFACESRLLSNVRVRAC